MSSMPQDFMFFFCDIEVFVLYFFASFFCVKKGANCKKEKMSSKRLRVTSKLFRAHHSC